MNYTLVALIAGCLAGNAVGAGVRKLNMGTVFNSVAGLVGGGLGGQLMMIYGPVTATAGGVILGQAAAGSVGGGFLIAVIGVLRLFVLR